MAFKSVAVAGKGQLGNFVVSELSRAEFKVTILTRSKSNVKDVPGGSDVVEVDYDSVASLTEALKGQDVLVATLAMSAISVQYKLIDAAARAGVKRLIPSEYSGITLDPSTWKFPHLQLMLDIQKLVRRVGEEGKMSYTFVAPGAFLNLMFNQPIMLNWDDRIAPLYDGGEQKVNISRLSTAAQAIRAVLEKGDTYKNQTVKVHDCTVSQRQILDIAKNERPDIEWKEINIDCKALVEESLEKIADGQSSPEVVGAMMIANSLSKYAKFCWTKDELENENLGIEGLTDTDVEKLIKKRAHGELVDLPKVYEGAWKIDLK